MTPDPAVVVGEQQHREREQQDNVRLPDVVAPAAPVPVAAQHQQAPTSSVTRDQRP